MEPGDKKTTALKIAGVLGILVPLLGAIINASFQYWQSVRENRDNNYREVINKLASGKPEERQAAATNLGVYLREPDFKEQTIDILVNTTAIELDTNVLSAIRSSLDKLNSPRDKKNVIQKLLFLGTSNFSWKEAIKEWRRVMTSELNESYQNFLTDLASLKREHDASIDALPADLLYRMNNLEEKSKIQGQASRQYSEIAIHEEIIADFIKSLLNNTRDNPVEGLEFFQNSFNYKAIIKAKLIDPKIVNSAVSRALLDSVEIIGIDGCVIQNTTFQYSEVSNSVLEKCEIMQTLFTGDSALLTNTSFAGSSFEDVFFYKADLKGTDFSGVKGLKAEYFYGSVNYDKAIFADSNFITEITAINQDSDRFLTYLANSTLSSQRYKGICADLKTGDDLDCLN